jgi:hypothetical protein
MTKQTDVFTCYYNAYVTWFLVPGAFDLTYGTGVQSLEYT